MAYSRCSVNEDCLQLDQKKPLWEVMFELRLLRKRCCLGTSSEKIVPGSRDSKYAVVFLMFVE